MMLIISAVALGILAFVIQKTRIGRALRAVSFDRDTAQLLSLIHIFPVVYYERL